MSDITLIFSAIERGDPQAASELLPLVYQELKRVAAERLRHEKPGQTLQSTALVHEAYLRLVGKDEPKWQSRAHFFSAAAEAMRCILVDNARRKKAVRHGGDLHRVQLADCVAEIDSPCDDVLALDEALTKLAAEDKTKADIVKLRFYTGLSIEETASALDISRATAVRYWTYARAWLHTELTRTAPKNN
jgi:RNA polymerase sigma factor (TIGR02999 family)